MRLGVGVEVLGLPRGGCSPPTLKRGSATGTARHRVGGATAWAVLADNWARSGWGHGGGRRRCEGAQGVP